MGEFIFHGRNDESSLGANFPIENTDNLRHYLGLPASSAHNLPIGAEAYAVPQHTYSLMGSDMNGRN